VSDAVNRPGALFAFKSFRARLLTFLLLLLIPVFAGIFYYVNRNNTEYTEETINRYLQLGADVFDYTRQQQAQTLRAITTSLTWDFGFRTAYAANDPATLFDAALNVLDRSMRSTDMLMIVNLDNQVVIDTALQGFDELQGRWLELAQQAAQSDTLTAETIASVNGIPYQLIMLPLYLPRQVAWIVGGFALDDTFVSRVRQTIVSEVSIVRILDQDRVEVIASTLPSSSQQALAAQLDTTGPPELQRINYADGDWTTLFRPLFTASGSREQVVAVIQRSFAENQVNVVQFRRLLIQFYSLVLVISFIAVLLLARSISRPLSRLATVVSKIEQGDYGMRAPVKTRDELGELADSVNTMARGLAEKEKVRDLLGKVVSQQIAEQLLSNPVELGGEERVVTILFSDIRGFTSYCEGLSPKSVLAALNQVLSEISNIIESHQGVVDKFQGDAVMALFGAPVSSDTDADLAMAAALDIVAALEKMDSELSACVGVNTGLVVAGNLGSANRLNYSVIGDTVNLAARLESLTRLYNTATIVSAASKAAAPAFCYRELDEVRVAGKQQSVTIFELQGRPDDISAAQRAENAQFAEALASYRQGEWSAAEAQFCQLQRTCDNKQLCQVFLDRITYFKTNPPAADWCGVYTFDKK
jgi:adenylate cyclase